MATREKRLLIFPLISLVLLLISFGLLSFWGYQIFYKSRNEKKSVVQKDSISSPSKPKDSLSTSNGTRDSLQKMYSAAISSLDDHPGSSADPSRPDSLQEGVKINPEDFYKLRNEISDLLRNPASNGDLELARQKIVELQDKIQQLHDRNVNVEQENKKLNAVLSRLLKNQVKGTFKPNIRSPQPGNVPPMIINELRLVAINVGDNSEVETTLAEQTNKFIGYFIAKNNNTYNNGEIFIVVTDPNGHVMQNSPWEAGNFETATGRKSYTCKINFDGNRPDGTRLQFTVNADNFEKGNYTVSIYYNGEVIKKLSKPLL